METALIIIGIVLVVGIGVLIALQFKREPKGDAALLREMLENIRRESNDGREKDREHLQKRMDGVIGMVQNSMKDSTKTIQTQFEQSTTIIKQVTEKLTKLDETNKQVLNFSAQLKDLESILKQPKGKGLLSEVWLETLLGHVLQPDQYRMQHKFKNGEIVDAVVFFQEKIIPIDAKFSSNNYVEMMQTKDDKRRTEMASKFKEHVKCRIDETAKYIRPSEGTTDFSFMFLPAEGIFYDLLVASVGTLEVNRISLVEYAFKKRVIIVSPATFFAYLQTVLQGLKAFKMQESIQEVLQKVEMLGKHVGAYEEYMKKMGRNLGTTVVAYNEAYKELKKIDKDVVKLTEGTTGGTIDPVLLEKPSLLDD